MSSCECLTLYLGLLSREGERKIDVGTLRGERKTLESCPWGVNFYDVSLSSSSSSRRAAGSAGRWGMEHHCTACHLYEPKLKCNWWLKETGHILHLETTQGIFTLNVD